MRNFGSSLGLTVLGTVLILEDKSRLEATLGAHGVPKGQSRPDRRLAERSGRGALAEHAGRGAQRILASVQHG